MMHDKRAYGITQVVGCTAMCDSTVIHSEEWGESNFVKVTLDIDCLWLMMYDLL